MGKISAGLLMFRRKDEDVEVFLVHPGGPFFKNKDEGAWTIPKGEPGDNEELLEAAKREFEEETGIKPADNLISLGEIKQKGGKIVHGWAFLKDIDDRFQIKSNSFEMEWPPHSGKKQTFPEIDKGEFFDIETAKQKINPAQNPFIEVLISKYLG